MATPAEAALESRSESTLSPAAGATLKGALESRREPALKSTGSAAFRPALESPLETGRDGDGADQGVFLREVGEVRRDEFPWELDRKLFVLCRERGPLRAVLSRIAARLVSLRAWERIGYARLSDYAVECLGLSARSVRGLAQVGAGLNARPLLEEAFVSGTLGWTKVRLLVRLPREEDEERWIAHARRVTAEELAREVRAVDRGSVEAGALEEEARSRRFEVRCTPEVRWKWEVARGAAQRAAGRMLHPAEAAELIAAEVLSALPIDEEAEEEGRCAEVGVSWTQESESARDAAASGLTGRGSGSEDGAAAAHPSARVPPGSVLGGGSTPHAAGRSRWRDEKAEAGGESAGPRPSFSPALKSLLEGLEEADAFEVDERFRRALAMERRLDGRTGPLLIRAWERWVHRALGYRTREAYARERLGMDPTRARSLVRLERTAVSNGAFARAYRTGELSWVKASVLEPLVSADPLGWFVEEWVTWAGRVTVRRLREDVERALALSETDPGAFRRGGGLPPEAQRDREIGAAGKGTEEQGSGADRDIGAGGKERDKYWEGADPGVGTAGTSGAKDQASEDREIGATGRGQEGDSSEANSGLGATSGTKPVRDEARRNREIGATGKERERYPAEADPWPHPHPEPLKSAPLETCWARFIGPADVVRLFRALLCTVRRRMERDTGHLPTEGEALGAMLDHVLSTWGALDERIAARHRVFARDGWRCAVPGCSSMQNLHEHHVRFRSAGGTDAPENRITLCAFHHLRGVHAGVLRCVGRAPDGLRWEMGIRPGVTPRLAYRSGDLRVQAPTAPEGGRGRPGTPGTR